MTDMETLVALLEKMGLKPFEGDHGELPRDGYIASRDGDGSLVTIGEGDGYSGFFGVFRFDEAGDILDHGLWE